MSSLENKFNIFRLTLLRKGMAIGTILEWLDFFHHCSRFSKWFIRRQNRHDRDLSCTPCLTEKLYNDPGRSEAYCKAAYWSFAEIKIAHLQSKARSLCSLASTPKTIFLSVAPLSAIASLCSTKLRELKHTYIEPNTPIQERCDVILWVWSKTKTKDIEALTNHMPLFLWETCGSAVICDASRELEHSRERLDPSHQTFCHL